MIIANECSSQSGSPGTPDLGVDIVSGLGEGGVGAWGIIAAFHISYQDKYYQVPSTSQLTFCVAWILISEQRVFRIVDDGLTSRCTPERSRAKARVTGMVLVLGEYSYS